jgi:DNA invertase Pin-like site-specific DNA recombinase
MTTVALYTRVSTTDQHCENQLRELRAYCAARGWTIAREYSDKGVSGAKADRAAFNELRTDARRRLFDTVLCWRLDRAGRSLPHLITFVQELHERGITFASLNEGIDFSTATGKLQFAMLAALAEFERDRIRERVICGLQRARAQGKRLGRRPYDIAVERFEAVAHLSVREAAKALSVSYSVVHRWRLSHRSTTAA